MRPFGRFFWVALALAFFGYLYLRYSPEAASLFLAGYVLEKALSVDNMMVFVAIFASFGIKGIMQHRILYYGIAGALIFRAIFVAARTAVFGLSHWIEVVFAAIVLWTGIKMFMGSAEEGETTDYSDHWSVKLSQRVLPVIPRMVGKRFVVGAKEAQAISEKEGFSLPRRAAFYATLGLRNLYFMLAAAAKYLVYLEKAVALVLIFIAGKLASSALGIYHIDHQVSMMVVLGLILGGVFASLLFPKKDEALSES